MSLRNKKPLAVLAAACLFFGLVGCQQNDVSTGQEQTSVVSSDTILPKVKEEETEAETTSALQNADINIETLAEGEQRDWSVEDVMKNDLEIDGIPISLPCTLNELLEVLGDDYSVKKSEVKDSVDGEINSKFRDFTGEFFITDLYYNGDDTYCQIHALISNPKKIDYDTIKVIGYFSGSGREVANLSLPDLTRGDSLDKCIKNYGDPDKVDLGKNGRVYLSYYDYDENDKRICWLQITVENNIVDNIWAEFENEDLENQ